MTATEMRAKAMKVNDEARKTEIAIAIEWIETEAMKKVEEAANGGYTRVMINTPDFTDNQKNAIVNHFHRYGFRTYFTAITVFSIGW